MEGLKKKLLNQLQMSKTGTADTIFHTLTGTKSPKAFPESNVTSESHCPYLPPGYRMTLAIK